MLNTDTMTLTHPHVHGASALPADREGHTASVVGGRIFVFGGTWTDDDDATIYMNDLHVLDVATMAWSRPPSGGTPPIEREAMQALANWANWPVAAALPLPLPWR